MGKELSEMTMEELWQLFPIILREHNEHYKEWYEEERMILQRVFIKEVKRINHIGSTSVKGLIAKPTVDILMEISPLSDIDWVKKRLQVLGWILMNEATSPELKLVFSKGYTKDGFDEKVYHLHVRMFGDWNELYFRDYLREHEEARKEYAELKCKLEPIYKYDRDGYTAAKTELIQKYTELAKKEYKGRYTN